MAGTLFPNFAQIIEKFAGTIGQISRALDPSNEPLREENAVNAESDIETLEEAYEPFQEERSCRYMRALDWDERLTDFAEEWRGSILPPQAGIRSCTVGPSRRPPSFGTGHSFPYSKDDRYYDRNAETTFKHLQLREGLLRRLAELGVEQLSRFERRCMRAILRGDDIIDTEYGSGHLNSVLTALLETTETSLGQVQILLLTQDLAYANDIQKRLVSIGKYMSVTCKICWNDVLYPQRSSRAPPEIPHVLIGTPMDVYSIIRLLKFDVRRVTICISYERERVQDDYLRGFARLLDVLEVDGSDRCRAGVLTRALFYMSHPTLWLEDWVHHRRILLYGQLKHARRASVFLQQKCGSDVTQHGTTGLNELALEHIHL